MAGTLRLSNTGTGNGQSTITTAASGDTTYTLPSGGGTFVTTSSTQALTVPFASGTVSAPSVTFLGDSNTGIYSPAADTIAFTEGGVESLRIDSSGRVGIGTTAPESLVHINGDATALRITRGSSIGFLYSEGTSTTSTFRVQANGGPLDLYSGSSQPITFSAATSEKARIDSSGRLLVGTSTAREFNSGWVQRLQVEGSGASQAEMASITYNDNGGTGPALVFGKTRGTASGSVTAVQNNDVLGKFRFFGANGTDLTNEGAAISVEVDGTPFSSGDTTDLPGRIVLSTTPDGSASPVERVRIASDGGVFINTTNTDPTANRVNGIYIATDNAIRCRVSGSGAAWNLGSSASALTHINFYTDNGSSRVSAGSILSNGSTTTYNTSSDYRLKENIVCLSNASDRLKVLKPVQFEWKKGFGGTQPLSEGFIAHELQEVCPLAVQGTKDEVDVDGNPVYQGIDQSKLVPLITAALQEALQKIETLEAANTDLAARITALEAN
jgi:hypothetical protein